MDTSTSPDKTLKTPKISFVIPVFNEEESLIKLVNEIHNTFSGQYFYEILFIDDGSTDKTLSIIKDLEKKDPLIKHLSMRRNFGKAAALSIGFENAIGEIMVTLDGDLQDDPAEVPKLLKLLESDYDLVVGWKWPRLDSWGKRVASKIYNRATRSMTGTNLHDMNSGMKVFRRDMLDNFKLYGDIHRYIPVLAQGKGFKVGEVKVKHRPRTFGKSKYSGERFIRGPIDLLTVLFLTEYFKRPAHFLGGFGLLFSMIGFLILLILSIGWFSGTPIASRPLFSLGILLLIVGVQMMCFGILAELITYHFHRSASEEYPIRDKYLSDSRDP